jgi:hypothetical protein
MIEVYGNSLASLLVVEYLTKNKISCNYFYQRNLPIGGHFSGIKYESKVFDVGMVLIEPGLKSDVKQKDISKYKNEYGFALSPYRHYLLNWFEINDIRLEEMDIKMLFRGKLVEDYILKDNLEFLREISSEDQDLLLEQISNCNFGEGELHPKNKRTNAIYHSKNLEYICKKIYGELFFEVVIAKWIDKLDYNRNIVAVDHRKVWLPLVYPENIIEFLTTGSSNLESPSYLTPVEISISELIDDIFMLISSSNTTKLNEVVEFNFKKEVKSTRIYLGSSAQLGIKYESKLDLEIKESIPLNFEYFITEKQKNFVVNVIDGKYIFRISSKFSSKTDKSIVTVEGNQLGSIQSDIETAKVFEQLIEQKIMTNIPIKFYEFKTSIRIRNKVRELELLKASENALIQYELLGCTIDSSNIGLHEQFVIAMSVIERLGSGK